jgi:hypothetical protein
MTAALLASLAAMALIDATSFGTLGVPVGMLGQPRVRISAILFYLGVIAAFYWALGIALLFGAESLLDPIQRAHQARATLWIQLGLGVCLMVAGFLPGNIHLPTRNQTNRPKRREKRKPSAIGEKATFQAVAVVALLAGLVEAASMLPYLGAIGLLTASGLPLLIRGALLSAYVVVMIAPALALVAGRHLARAALAPLLEWLDRWLRRNSAEVLGWVIGLVGFFMASDAAAALDLFPKS